MFFLKRAYIIVNMIIVLELDIFINKNIFNEMSVLQPDFSISFLYNHMDKIAIYKKIYVCIDGVSGTYREMTQIETDIT